MTLLYPAVFVAIKLAEKQPSMNVVFAPVPVKTSRRCAIRTVMAFYLPCWSRGHVEVLVPRDASVISSASAWALSGTRTGIRRLAQGLRMVFRCLIPRDPLPLIPSP
jgi:hypothetical protein